jgi:hypothetical protein
VGDDAGKPEPRHEHEVYSPENALSSATTVEKAHLIHLSSLIPTPTLSYRLQAYMQTAPAGRTAASQPRQKVLDRIIANGSSPRRARLTELTLASMFGEGPNVGGGDAR